MKKLDHNFISPGITERGTLQLEAKRLRTHERVMSILAEAVKDTGDDAGETFVRGADAYVNAVRDRNSTS